MYDINDLTPKVARDRTSQSYVVMFHDPYYAVGIIWASTHRADKASAEGFASDIRDAMADLRCTWCSQPATRVSAIGDLDKDVTDITGWCDGDHCYHEAMAEVASQR